MVDIAVGLNGVGIIVGDGATVVGVDTGVTVGVGVGCNIFVTLPAVEVTTLSKLPTTIV